MEQFCDNLIWILYYKNSKLTHQYELCECNWYCFPCYKHLICLLKFELQSDLKFVIANVVLCLTVIESQFIIYSDLRWPLKIWGLRMNRRFWELTVPAVHGNTYLFWWWSSLNIMNVVFFTCADKQHICYSYVSSNALNVMIYELLNPMFCVSLCLQLWYCMPTVC